MNRSHVMKSLAGLMLALVIAGCNNRPTVAPTAQPSATTAASPTRTIVGPTVAPSWTPGVAPTSTKAPSTPTKAPPTLRAGEPSLPPSWTPFVVPTVTSARLVNSNGTPTTPTVTPASRATQATPRFGETRLPPPTLRTDAVYAAACAKFGQATPMDFTIPTGTTAQLSWTPVEGAEGYHVWIFNPSERYNFDRIVKETTITIPKEVFIGPGNYGWEVMPIKNNDRLCVSLTGVIVARIYVGGTGK